MTGPFGRIAKIFWRSRANYGRLTNVTKTADTADGPLYCEDSFERPVEAGGYLVNAWVNIAVGILIRNIARAGFMVTRDGEEVQGGPLPELFRRPNGRMNCFDLWKETAAWWFLEGEAFWWFGPEEL